MMCKTVQKLFQISELYIQILDSFSFIWSRKLSLSCGVWYYTMLGGTLEVAD